jgi:hypothetical protein
MLTGMQCKGNGPVEPAQRPLELLYPKGGSGQTFKVGDTVRIRWSIHDVNAVKGVGVSYSLDGGATVKATQIISTKQSTYPDTTLLWEIDESYISDKFVLVIWEYNSLCISGSSACTSPFDKSAPFSVFK